MKSYSEWAKENRIFEADLPMVKAVPQPSGTRVYIKIWGWNNEDKTFHIMFNKVTDSGEFIMSVNPYAPEEKPKPVINFQWSGPIVTIFEPKPVDDKSKVFFINFSDGKGRYYSLMPRERAYELYNDSGKKPGRKPVASAPTGSSADDLVFRLTKPADVKIPIKPPTGGTTGPRPDWMT